MCFVTKTEPIIGAALILFQHTTVHLICPDLFAHATICLILFTRTTIHHNSLLSRNYHKNTVGEWLANSKEYTESTKCDSMCLLPLRN